MQDAQFLCADIRDVRGSDLRPAGVGSNWRPDLLAGGPPCQPFSSAGRQLGVDDPRGRHFLEFVRLARELHPRQILFENVRGLVTAKSPDGEPGGVLKLVQAAFEDAGYACRFALLNAADFGAAQRRIRIVMLAACDSPVAGMPQPTHASSAEPIMLARVGPWATLGEFLKSRPPPAPEEIIRPKGARAAALLALQPGTGIRTGGIVEANRPGGHWGYRQDSFVADPSLPSRTIRAAATPDWIRLDDGTLRRLTWRECAALQGFPAEWAFAGTTASRFRQIGNAVQTDMACAVGRSLIDAIRRAGRRVRPSSHPWPSEFARYISYTAMEHRVNGTHRKLARSKQPSGGTIPPTADLEFGPVAGRACRS